LQARCEELGVILKFDCDVESDLDFPDADLIIASDGINSKIRTTYENVFKPDIVTRPNRYIWLGTQRLYDAFTFDFQKTETRLVSGAYFTNSTTKHPHSLLSVLNMFG